MTPILKVRDVHKAHQTGKVPVSTLRGKKLEIEREEAVAIFCPPGSGKSTLIHVSGGLDKPDEFDPQQCLKRVFL